MYLYWCHIALLKIRDIHLVYRRKANKDEPLLLKHFHLWLSKWHGNLSVLNMFKITSSTNLCFPPCILHFGLKKLLIMAHKIVLFLNFEFV